MLEVKIKYVTDIKPIEVNDIGDWIDLRAGKTMELDPFEFAYIPLGADSNGIHSYHSTTIKHF